MSSPDAPVVLIDDNADDLVLTEQILRKAGIANPIIVAPGGEEAIELFRSFNSKKHKGPLPALVLCDVRMPGADGFEVLKWVRNQPQFADVYFVMHTGGNVPADRARAHTLGADEFLVKFPSPTEMRRVAAVVFGSKEARTHRAAAAERER